MVAVKSFYGVDISGPDQAAAASAAELADVFEYLKPKGSKTPLIRIGGDRDGSYLLPDDLDGIAACFSPGVNRIKYFEDFLADRYGIESHMCDFSADVDALTTPLKSGQTFLKKWLDPNPGEDNISLEDWMREHEVEGDLLLQMDIEGAEFRNILATSAETLARFRVIVLEMHGLDKMLDGAILRGVIAPFFSHLSRSFTTVHAHPNNCCGDFAIPDSDIRIPRVLELTLVRNDWFVPVPGPTELPHPLDVSRNVPRKAPLFLSEAWCDYQRPLASRVKILEDTLRYRDEVGATGVGAELSAALSLMAESLQTLSRPMSEQDRELVEVAAGRPYRLSTAYGKSSKVGVVEPRGNFFFHTDFGADESIEVDLGQRHRIRRIEVTNRRNGFQERAKHIFAVLTDDVPGQGLRRVFPVFEKGPLPGAAWQECGIDLADVPARYVTITSPTNTALHFSDLRIYAAPAEQPSEPENASLPRVVLRKLKNRLRRLRPRS